MTDTERLATAPENRLASIDVLRGFALLGILVMNVQAFSMPLAAYSNPHAWGDLTGANYAVWLVSRLFFDSKFISIFSMLFGAGIAMMAAREVPGQQAIYFRRYAILLVIGLLHAYLLWYGDVLAFYAVCAFILYPFRHKAVSTLLIASGILYALPAAMLAVGALSAPFFPQVELERLRVQFAPESEELLPQIATMQGGFWEIFLDRLPFLFQWHFLGFPVMFLPMLLALMLLGMVLHRLGAVQAHWPGKRYALLAVLALIIGVPMVYAGVLYLDAVEWSAVSVAFDGSLFNYFASPLVALGWIGVVMLWCQSGRLPRLRHALSCVGRMALTNYLMQTVIGVLVFYGFGLGWHGEVERTGQLVFVLCVWALQLAWSPLWLHYFRFGPMEWLWRSLTYGQLQPMRREA